MSREDFYHKYVKAALVAADWTIVTEQFKLPFFRSKVKVDIIAQKTETDGSVSQIAVEVKNFRVDESYTNEFQKALGQYLLYRDLLEYGRFDYPLYLAVPEYAYKEFFTIEPVKRLVATYRIKLVTFDPVTQTLVQWIP